MPATRRPLRLATAHQAPASAASVNRNARTIRTGERIAAATPTTTAIPANETAAIARARRSGATALDSIEWASRGDSGAYSTTGVDDEASVPSGDLPPGQAGSSIQTWVEALRQATVLDDALYRAVAATATPALDQSMSDLSDAATHSKLWFAVAAAIAVTGGRRGRRAAAEGLAAIALASTVVNQGLKRVMPRNRPLRDELSIAADRWVRMPSSTSFPSGHSASAFAFAHAVSARIPLLWLPLQVAATAVAYSRVHTGVHYPADAIAGASIGAACGEVVHRASEATLRPSSRV